MRSLSDFLEIAAIMSIRITLVVGGAMQRGLAVRSIGDGKEKAPSRKPYGFSQGSSLRAIYDSVATCHMTP